MRKLFPGAPLNLWMYSPEAIAKGPAHESGWHAKSLPESKEQAVPKNEKEAGYIGDGCKKPKETGGSPRIDGQFPGPPCRPGKALPPHLPS